MSSLFSVLDQKRLLYLVRKFSFLLSFQFSWTNPLKVHPTVPPIKRSTTITMILSTLVRSGRVGSRRTMSTAKMHKFSETGEALAKTRPPPGHDHVSFLRLLMPTFWVLGWELDGDWHNRMGGPNIILLDCMIRMMRLYYLLDGGVILRMFGLC